MMTRRTTSGSFNLRAISRAFRNALLAMALYAAAGVMSSVRSVGAKTSPWSKEYSSKPSVVAAAQVWPVGDNVTALLRMAALRLAPVPGRFSALPGPPVSQAKELYARILARGRMKGGCIGVGL